MDASRRGRWLSTLVLCQSEVLPLVQIHRVGRLKVDMWFRGSLLLRSEDVTRRPASSEPASLALPTEQKK